MSPKPTGQIRATKTGADLILKRTFRGTLEDVWESVTASESTARWFGSWEGEAGVGKTVVLTMLFEQGAPKSNVMITACEPPRHLALTTKDDYGEWHLELTLEHANDVTELTFVQHLVDPSVAADAGPGWEYYLDMLVAARAGEPLPEFASYYPSQKAFYSAAIEAARAKS